VGFFFAHHFMIVTEDEAEADAIGNLLTGVNA